MLQTLNYIALANVMHKKCPFWCFGLMRIEWERSLQDTLKHVLYFHFLFSHLITKLYLVYNLFPVFIEVYMNSLNLLFSVLGSDVVYSEGAVVDLLETLGQLSGPNTTIFLAGELRNGKDCIPFSAVVQQGLKKSLLFLILLSTICY